MSRTIEVSVGAVADALIQVKIQTFDCEINIQMTQQELAGLPRLVAGRWDDRGSLQLGQSAGSPVFWSCQVGELSILVGSDDETWDIGVMLPESVVDQIMTEAQRELG